ncbi:aromatic acid/H+ symport family MFS transporter [Pantoea sp. 1.19]|uniref:MFS transporter n=1 Tax=Pantoea sp. 1.19 TaxID=1925589 RepID=UPI000948C5C7|nr:aromatic acid/H+ symport family MFS transporter [Pantoea sp. 1.19]
MAESKAIDVRALIDSRPLGRWQKWVVLFGFCIIALDGFDIAIMGFIAPELKADWGISNRELGLVISAALIGLALGAMLSGPLSDWLGRKVVIVNSVFFFGAWTLATAFSQNMEQMILFRFLTGLGLGAAMPNVGTLVAEFAPARRRAFLITVVFCGFTFGAALGGFAASWLMPHFGWHAVLLLGGILPILFVPLLLWALPESVCFLVVRRAASDKIHRILAKLAPDLDLHNATVVLPPAGQAIAHPVRVVLNAQYRFGSLMLWGAYFTALFLFYTLGSWLPLLIKDNGFDVTQAAIITALFQAGGTAGSLFSGWLMDRMEPHRALALIYGGGALFTAGMGVTIGHPLLLGGCAMMIGFCIGGANTGMNALSASFYPTEARATGSSWMHGIGRIGAILSALAGAEMLALGWRFTTIFAVLAIPALLTVAMIVAKGHRQRRRSAERLRGGRWCVSPEKLG